MHLCFWASLNWAFPNPHLSQCWLSYHFIILAICNKAPSPACIMGLNRNKLVPSKGRTLYYFDAKDKKCKAFEDHWCKDKPATTFLMKASCQSICEGKRRDKPGSTIFLMKASCQSIWEGKRRDSILTPAIKEWINIQSFLLKGKFTQLLRVPTFRKLRSGTILLHAHLWHERYDGLQHEAMLRPVLLLHRQGRRHSARHRDNRSARVWQGWKESKCRLQTCCKWVFAITSCQRFLSFALYGCARTKVSRRHQHL